MAENAWADTLSAARSGSVQVAFEGVGLEGTLNPLSGDEMQECINMGGERGRKYALYLACPDIQAAGRELCDRGELIIPFDVMEHLGFADVTAAYEVICGISGGYGGVKILQQGAAAEDMETFAVPPAKSELILPEERVVSEVEESGEDGFSSRGQVAAEQYPPSQELARVQGDNYETEGVPQEAWQVREHGKKVGGGTEAVGETSPRGGGTSVAPRQEHSLRPRGVDIDFIAGELCRRLIDAAGSM